MRRKWRPFAPPPTRAACGASSSRPSMARRAPRPTSCSSRACGAAVWSASSPTSGGSTSASRARDTSCSSSPTSRRSRRGAKGAPPSRLWSGTRPRRAASTSGARAPRRRASATRLARGWWSGPPTRRTPRRRLRIPTDWIPTIPAPRGLARGQRGSAPRAWRSSGVFRRRRPRWRPAGSRKRERRSTPRRSRSDPRTIRSRRVACAAPRGNVDVCTFIGYCG
mmetsp:Transcript_19413/g.64130  ORF Transcript_19413/g.64130 Transcript_19413/m.64130 type:complete len:223 (-) Transcript_19413:8-676(-)